VLTLSGKLHLAPVGSGVIDVLDVATGTGIWAIEFANNYPYAKVVGTDLSPIQPEHVPSNCRFEVDDAEEPWVYPHQFDYIHGRLLVTCFRDFPAIVAQTYSFLKPGGYFELQDILPPTCYDDSWEGTAIKRLTELLTAGGAKLGMDWMKASKYRQYMIDAGLEDVKELHFAWPSNEKWPKGSHYKTLGLWYYQNMMNGLQGISMAVLTRVWGWSKEEVDVFMVDVKRDYANRNIRCYQPV
jgi:ubiquinone/menaquinone biosynthesis C-methylase UbiE